MHTDIVNLDRKVVTVWYNDPRDNHVTLRLSEYTWNINVIDHLRRL